MPAFLCAYAEDAMWQGWTAAIHDRATHLAIPPLRLLIRHGPEGRARTWLWDHVVGPYFAWHAHPHVARTAFGSFGGNTIDLLEQYLYFFGVWEPNLTAWVSERMRPGDVFVDVGANVGYFSLLASTLVGQAGAVVAIEASPVVFDRLLANVTRNGARNVRALNVAASDDERELTLYFGPKYHTGVSSTITPDLSANGQAIVQGRPLAGILEPGEIARARFVKIDVEGAEWSVVSGLLPILDRTRGDLELCVEVSPERLALQGRSAAEVLEMFERFGFHPYSLENDYTASSYLRRRAPRARPVRLREAPAQEIDVVFSRIDAASL
jgi:FkbM family methyltransferase